MAKNFEETIQWYDRNAIRYAQATEKHASDYQIEEFCKFLKPGDFVLDAGCGGGRDTKLLCEKGIVTIGLDISAGLIEVAKSKYPQIEFVEGDFTDLEFPNNYFNGIWAHASLVHFDNLHDTEIALIEFNRVLKSEGILHTTVKKKKKKGINVVDNFLGQSIFFQHFRPKEIKDLIDRSGFVILKTEIYNEAERFPDGRKEVDWIRILAQKV